MAIYELLNNGIRPIAETSFSQAKVRERGDLQRLLREQIDVISPDTLVIAEEFGEWEDSKRRIDLLGLDKDANLVVIELKRTDDGGHMELQAIRYASMVSTLTFDRVVDVYESYLQTRGIANSNARDDILDFLNWEEPDEEQFAQDVRIVLAAADFSKELTTAVIWLNERTLDIRCVRMKPYADADRLLLDVQQIIPLPEATEYQIRIREKVERERLDRREKTDRAALYRAFWAGLLDVAREHTDLHARISSTPHNWLGATAQASVSGLMLVYVLSRSVPRVELYIDTGDKAQNETIYRTLEEAHRAAIDERFGGSLVWEPLELRRACRIRHDLSPVQLEDESQWSECHKRLVNAMIRFEDALRPALNAL